MARIGAHVIDTSAGAWDRVNAGFRYGDVVDVTDDKGYISRGLIVNVWNWREDKPLDKIWVSFPGPRASFTVPVRPNRLRKI